ncbi:MAG TPA: SDR family NAD(P)-dependent oxidoreductase [Pseudomonadales bacterium]|nr:SDR family NAD(P)-dependent oxidoreductase [Pseudomonadales bacterium]
MQRFTERNVLITGAGAGIGRATAVRIASEGGRVFCVDVSGDGLVETVRQVAGVGGNADWALCDVGSLDSVRSAVKQAVATMGSLHVLVNVAGVIKMQNFERSTDENWHRIIGINLTGTYWMCREAIPHLLESKGNIVNVSSTSAIRGLPWGAAYAASKGGVSAMTKSIAVEFAKQGLRANTVCPGSISTGMNNNSTLPEKMDFSLIPRIDAMMGSKGPEYVASVIALLASEQDGGHITGSEYVMDGGTVM